MTGAPDLDFVVSGDSKVSYQVSKSRPRAPDVPGAAGATEVTAAAPDCVEMRFADRAQRAFRVWARGSRET